MHERTSGCNGIAIFPNCRVFHLGKPQITAVEGRHKERAVMEAPHNNNPHFYLILSHFFSHT